MCCVTKAKISKAVAVGVGCVAALKYQVYGGRWILFKWQKQQGQDATLALWNVGPGGVWVKMAVQSEF